MITSVSNGVESGYSPEALGQPLPGDDTTPPDVPTGLSANAPNHYTIDLSWNANTELDFDTYTLYRSSTPGSGYSVLLIGNESDFSPEASETVPLNWRTGDINWGTLPSQGGYVDLNNDGALQFGNNKIWVFQIADSVDTNTLYDVALKLTGVTASPKETGFGIGIGNNHSYSNESFSISLEGVYVRGTTGLADRGLDIGTQPISGDAVAVTGSTLFLVDWAQETAGTLTNAVFGGTNFVWYGIQGNNQGGLDWSHFRVVGGIILSGFQTWAGGWNVELGIETDDFDNDGIINLY